MEHLDSRKKTTIMIAVIAAMLFAALNQTIVSTALPRIIERLGGMEYYSWVFTVYMLTSSITTILVGKLSDIYGRKPFILTGIGLFLVGSFLCGTSHDIVQLIMYRGIQGLGGGMIMSTAFSAVGDLFSPRERGRWTGIMSGAFGLSSLFGPTLGGYIVDHTEWHWVFWVFLPFGFIAFFMILFMFPKTERKTGETVDYLGSLFLTLTMVPMLLAFSWAGSKYDWGSGTILLLFGGAMVALILFIFTELKVKSPVLPMHLFRNSIFTVSNLAGFLLGAGMFGAIMYMPWFIQGVMGTSASLSGFITMPMMLSMVVASAVCGQLTTKTGKYKGFALFGTLTMGAGMYLLSFMSTDTTTFTVIINMIITGLGLGMAMPVFTLTVQNAVDTKMLGVATSSSQLFRTLGGTIGVSVMSTILSHTLISKMTADKNAADGLQVIPAADATLLKELNDPQILLDPGKLEQMRSRLSEGGQPMFDQLVMFMREALSGALSSVFLTGAVILIAGFILTWFIKAIPLRTSQKRPASTEPDESGPKRLAHE
ncbi:MDR family MFS transporter [Paenibacillus prosopidis]|uniref:EmrB/QacA subfamily drug resistance transporter n=1 Tax=Paenibacillus prosopidis TaxID=630520 RepID=A0A368VLZ9_9BACL|nr:MDR family MFS transporter [Paenibacillus prosopidis]RCW42540.1 EmrB/QacA subfamily drug resistance transporter [Paenibacillus prosopidis]